MSSESDNVPSWLASRRASVQMHNQFSQKSNALQSGIAQGKINPPKYYMPLHEAADSKEPKRRPCNNGYGIQRLAHGTLHFDAVETAAFYNAPKFIVTFPQSSARIRSLHLPS